MLHFACEHGYSDLAKKLIEEPGVSIDAENKWGSTPLGFAANSPEDIDLMVLTTLIEKGADVNKKSKIGKTPLFAACHAGVYDRVDELIKHGADVQLICEDGETTLMEALESEGDKEDIEKIALLLIEKGVDVHSIWENDTAFNIACREGHTKVARKLFEMKAGIHFEVPGELTAFGASCLAGLQDIAEELLKDGANIHAIDDDNESTLMLACKGSLSDMALELIERKVKLDTVSKKGETALHLACKFGLTKVIKKLLELGVKVEEKEGQQDVFNLLLAHGGSQNEELALQLLKKYPYSSITHEGLMLAIDNGWSKVTLNLLSLGSWPPAAISLAYFKRDDEATLRKVSPLTLACEKGLEEVALQLIDMEASLHSDRQEFYAASKHNQSKVIEKLRNLPHPLVNDDDFFRKDEQGTTALHYLFRNGNTKLIEEFYSKGLNLSLKDSDDKTLLELFVESHAWQNQAKLPELKATLNLLFKDFPLIHERVESHGVQELREYLRSHARELATHPRNSPNCNPYQVAFLLNDLPLVRVLAKLESERAFRDKIAALEEMYPKGNVQEFAFIAEYEVNAEHLTGGHLAEPIPAKIEGSLDDMLAVFKQLQKIDSKKYSDKTFKSLERFLKKLKKKEGFKGQPKIGSDTHKKLFQDIENALSMLFFALKMEEDDACSKTKQSVLDEFIAASDLCFPRVLNTAIMQYHRVVRAIEPSFINLLHASLASFRSLLLEGLVPQGEESLHDHTILLKALGKKLGIPGAHNLSEFEDPYEESGSGVNVIEAEKAFLRLYNSYTILTQSVEPDIHQDPELREQYGPFWIDHVPKDYGLDLNQKHKEEVRSLQQRKESRQAITRYLENQDIFFEEGKSFDEVFEGMRKQAFIDNEVYENMAQNKFRRSHLISMLTKAKVLNKAIQFAI